MQQANKIIKNIFLFLLPLLFCQPLFPIMLDLKSIISIDGMQDNPVLGYGIVVGLKGTGDSSSSQTKEMISRIANNFGFKINPEELKPKNCAVVLVSSVLSPFSQPGSKIDIKVSSIFDAKSLDGGELVITPLISGDNQIYAVASGSLLTERNSKGVIGSVPQGAIVQKAIENNLVDVSNQIYITVQERLGLSAVNKVVEVIQGKYPDSVKKVANNKIILALPENRALYQFVSEINKLKVDIDEEARVLIDSKSGIVISGGNVIITEAAISYGGTKINIGNSSPAWGNNKASEQNVKVIKNTATVQDLADALNQIGASGNDLAKILELLYKNGNLKAKLSVQ
jgi:flagellar P-ring protein precursor FlgI